jgi:hypothetical protein
MNKNDMIKSGIGFSGRVKLEAFKKDGSLKFSTGWMYNTVTRSGVAALMGLLGNVDSQTAFGYLEVGTSSTAAAATQTALVAAITDSGLARAAATVTRETTNFTNDTLQFYKQWSVTGTKTVEEIGIFNAASAGVMLGRKVTGSKDVAADETLAATYQIIGTIV